MIKIRYTKKNPRSSSFEIPDSKICRAIQVLIHRYVYGILCFVPKMYRQNIG